MERNTRTNGMINLLLLLALGSAGFVVARLTHSLAGILTGVFMGFGALVAAVSWFQMRLEENERLEKLEFDELARSKGSSTLFEVGNSEVFPAQRSREQFERFFVPAFTILLFLAEAVGALLLWRWLSEISGPRDARQSTVTLALFGLTALVLFLFGKFSASIARQENHRLLRPGASWLLLSAYFSFLVALGAAGVELGLDRADVYLARVLCAVLGLLALESLVSLVLELYRPRVKGKVARPLYESRLVGLLGHPEGLITTAAQALDYQFGFKVSNTWFYRFVERWFLVLLLAQFGVLLLSTTVVFIEPGEQGLLEHFGRRPAGGALLEPGAHFKWPWPIDRVYRYRTEQVQSFNVGFIPDPKLEELPTVLWTVPHTKEEVNFLVAAREPTSVTATNADPPPPPVNLLTVSVPVQFQITNLMAWAYNNENPGNLLEDLATREVVRYLVSVDLTEVMSRERSAAAETLRNRIQAAADERQLGARIVFVGVQDIHPPVKVAPDFEKLVGAEQTRLAKITNARAEGVRANALADAAAAGLINQALAERTTRVTEALAQAALFTNQIPAFQAAPSVYTERKYLEMFARATANARKYILLTTNAQDAFVFDLQDKIRADILNMNVTPQGK